MHEKYNFIIARSTEELIESQGKKIKSWIIEAMSLGLLVQRNKIFQVIGDDFVPLKITDFQPYPQNYPNGQDVAFCSLKPEKPIFAEAKKSGESVVTWVRRSMTLRLMSDNMKLVYLDEDGYAPIDTTEDFF
jgi:hypothetical protein